MKQITCETEILKQSCRKRHSVRGLTWGDSQEYQLQLTRTEPHAATALECKHAEIELNQQTLITITRITDTQTRKQTNKQTSKQASKQHTAIAQRIAAKEEVEGVRDVDFGHDAEQHRPVLTRALHSTVT